MNEYPIKSTARPYIDNDGNMCTLAQLAKREPERVAAKLLDLESQLAEANKRNAELEALINTPHLHDFSESVVLEACHQRERWGVSHDANKTPEDYFWLIGYLAGKLLRAVNDGTKDKALHHTISVSAVLANWHASISDQSKDFQPGQNGIESLNPTNKDDSIAIKFCQCETVTKVARDGKSTCGQCGGIDAYKKSALRKGDNRE